MRKKLYNLTTSVPLVENLNLDTAEQIPSLHHFMDLIQYYTGMHPFIAKSKP